MTNNSGSERVEFSLAIHGGAGTIARGVDDEVVRAYHDALSKALEVGRSILARGGASLDAVEATVVYLEDTPLFNAGKGAVFTAKGEHELDAAIMDGRTLDNGAVAGVRHVKNPISLARLVMESSEHSLLAAQGAEEFARIMEVGWVEQSYFYTDKSYERWQRDLARDRVSTEAGEIERGTVGAVALDRYGNLATATSTGGLTNKRFGRVGDSPLIGIGTYANNRTCAISCTGHGEEFIRHTAAHRVSAMMEYARMSLRDAMNIVVHTIMPEGSGGIIAVDGLGNTELVYNTPGMYRGAVSSSSPAMVRIWDDV